MDKIKQDPNNCSLQVQFQDKKRFTGTKNQGNQKKNEFMGNSKKQKESQRTCGD